MNKKSIIIIIVILLAFLISLWAPWMSEEFVENRINGYYETMNAKVTDGCSIKCGDCGILSYEKTFFGAEARVHVRCGLQYPDSPPSEVLSQVNNFGFVDFKSIN
jgi:hypothetical protein